MQLRRLDVENIRSYERGQLDLAAGTTLVVGDVGAGKSSLLYAIEMALFGVAEIDATYLVRHGAHHAEVDVRFEDGNHRYEIVRRFRRVRRKGRETFESEKITFRVDGAPTTYTPTEIRARVIELLGFPDNPNPQAHSDLWRWAIYVPQEQMREILSAKPQERLETIRKALGVERFRIAAENAEDLAAELRAAARHRREAAGRLAYHDRDFAEATAAADRLRQERVGLAEQIHRRTDALTAARTEVEALARQVQVGESAVRELEGAEREDAGDASALVDRARTIAERRRELDRRRDEVAVAARDAERLPARSTALAEREEAVRLARAELDRHAEASRALAAARAALEAAERRLAEAIDGERRAAGLEEEARQGLAVAAGEGPAHEPPAPTPAPLAEIDRRLADARAAERTSADELVRHRHDLAEVDELLAAGVCPRCRQTVDPLAFGPHRREAEAATSAAEARHASAVAARERLEAERQARERYERAHDRWVEVEKRRATLRAALAARSAERAAARSALEAAGTGARAAREQVAALAPREEAARALAERLAAAEAARDAARRELEGARLADERARALSAAVDALAIEIARSAEEVALLERRRAERAGRLGELRAEIAAAAATRAKFDAARGRLTVAESALADDRGALVRADTRLDNELRRRDAAERGRAERALLTAEAAERDQRAAWVAGPFHERLLAMEGELLAHAQEAFDRHFVRFFASLVDDPGLVARTGGGFTPEVLIEGEPTPPEALSGGERTALALAFRLALSTVVRSLGGVRLQTLLLDEPTDGFSAEQVVRMGELLGALELPQVVIVSHEAQLTSIADRTIRVVKRDGRAVLEADARATPDEPASAPSAAEPAPPAPPPERPAPAS
ncbi:MAG TPA: AAA family ATPase [Thermoplasmata archaeon]|nr:AAA family ATPase [Thermoplasmata archaeon]